MHKQVMPDWTVFWLVLVTVGVLVLATRVLAWWHERERTMFEQEPQYMTDEERAIAEDDWRTLEAAGGSEGPPDRVRACGPDQRRGRGGSSRVWRLASAKQAEMIGIDIGETPGFVVCSISEAGKPVTFMGVQGEGMDLRSDYR